MVTCSKCGTNNRNDAVYCTNCGSSLEEKVIARRHYEEPDYLGALSAGVALIILAFTYLRYPFDFNLVIDYFENVVTRRAFFKPPLTLLDPAIFFFYLIGIWSLLLSGLRIIFQRSVGKAVGDLTGGLFSLFFAGLLTNYAHDLLSGRAVLAYFVIGIGVVAIVNALISLSKRQR